MRPMGCRPARKACIAGACIGVSITPGETAFTRIPCLAYSIASARVTALRPPLVRAASADGKRCRRLLRDRGGDVDDMAGAGLQHARRCPLRDVKKSREVRRGRRREVGLRIVDERLGDEDAGIVHQRVDASIALDGRADDALGSVGRGDIAVDRQHRGISRNIAGPDRAGGRDDAVADGAEALHQVSADAARRAGDDDHLRFGTRRLDHSKTPAWRSPMPTWFTPRRRSDDRHRIDRSRSAPGGLGRCCGGWRAIASIAARRAAYPRPAFASLVPRQLSDRPCGASFGRSAAHSSRTSSAGHIAFPQSVRPYSTLGGTCG